MCTERNISTQAFTNITTPGWVNKPKGLLQILFERGFIDPELVKKPSKMRYSRNGKKDDIDETTGVVKDDCQRYALSYLMNNCSDFINQKTDVEELCDEIGGRLGIKCHILFTPKFHCEIAGEGIEYSWGASKRIYRRHPLSKKRSIFEFKNLVDSSVKTVTIPMVRKFSRRARRYMLTYSHAQLKHIDKIGEREWSFQQNERIFKLYSSHRDANSFDGKFIEDVLKKSIYSNL